VPAKIHRIKLSESERKELEAIRDPKPAKGLKVMPAMALLLCDEGPQGPAKTDREIHEITGLSIRTIERLRERCCEVGPLEAIQRKARTKPGRETKITGEVEAHITQLACSKAPAGHARWTLRLLAKRLVVLEVIDSISHQSVGTVLKKANSSRGGSSAGASLPGRTPLS
jgi:transposase